MKILIADYQPQMISALRLLVAQNPKEWTVAEVNQASHLMKTVTDLTPDVLLLNWELPGFDPFFLIPRLTFLYPSLMIVAISGRPEVREEAMALGVHLFFHRWERIHDLLEKIEERKKREQILSMGK